MKKGLAATLAAAGLALAFSASAGAGGVVYAPKDCTTPKVEPKRIVLACGDADTLLKHLGWSDWNADKVTGHGQFWINDCDPNCSAGSFDKFKVKVSLLNIRTSTCGGMTVPMYQRAHVRFRGKAPDNADQLRSFKLFCNA